MKKAIVALLLIFLHVHSVFAKKDFSVDSIKGILSGKEWRLLSPTVRVINQGWIVGDSTITVFYESKKDGERVTSQSGYYISETKDPQFDPAKVGTNKEGKYIIIGIMRDNPASSEKVCETVIYEIENITSTSLVVTSRGERFVFSTSSLQGKDWVVKSPQIDSIKRGWIFNDTIMTRYIELNDGKRADIEVQYYLSDAKDETFDKEKVGTTAQGKYIIAHRKQMVGKIPTAQYATEQFEIVSLSPDELVVISPLGTKAVLEANE